MFLIYVQLTYSNFQVGDRPPDPTDVLCFFHCVKRLFKRFFLKSSDCRLLNEGVALGDTDERGLDGATGHSMLITVKNTWKITQYGRLIPVCLFHEALEDTLRITATKRTQKQHAFTINTTS